MNKRMKTMLIGVGVLFGCIFLYKVFTYFMIKRFMANQSQIITVSTLHADYSSWQPTIKATASLRAIQGVDVTTSLAGMVKTIYFIPGETVTKGTLLVQLNADSEIGQLQSLKANLALAEITYKRDQAQYAIHAISKQTLDTDRENVKSLEGQVAEQAATVAKKTIRAPFTGRLGINAINLGQYINPGDKIVTLQTVDPIYADFFIPQQSLSKIKVGQQVTVFSDAFHGKKFSGKITTINPAIDVSTRNVEVEATVSNREQELTPGMFASVEINVEARKQFLTLPQTAISYNSYGDIVYIIKEKGKDKKNQPILNAFQVFVTTGETRGDQVAILKGLNKGDLVVTGGQLKLKNGSQVAINNSIQPDNNPAPAVTDE